MLAPFIQSLLEPKNLIYLFGIVFILRFMFFTTLENLFHFKPFKRSEVIISDFLTLLTFTVIIFPVSNYLSYHAGISGSFLKYFSNIPLVLRICIFYVIVDFLHYWVHRLMHKSVLWNAHKWHHSPKHMSWMAGFRTTLLDATLLNLGFVFAWPILGNISYGTIIFIFALNILINDWSHLNIRLRLPLLEKVFITPRFHHIHHSSAHAHYTKNLSAVFPIWDKLFGTYVDPDDVHDLEFGLDKEVPTARLVIGY